MTKIILTGSLKERNENTARLVNVSEEDVAKAQQVLIDNGIDEDEADCVLQALGYALLGVELYPNEITNHEPSENPYVLEFKHDFMIGFSYKGKNCTTVILLEEIEKDFENNKWHYTFSMDNSHFDVFGTLDDLGIVRTTGTCICKGVPTLACFGINVFTDGDEDFETIDDIDIIEAN